jgi:hypothetical protein
MAGKSTTLLVRLSDLGSGGSPAACFHVGYGKLPIQQPSWSFFGRWLSKLVTAERIKVTHAAFGRLDELGPNELYPHHVRQVEFTQGTHRLMEPPFLFPYSRKKPIPYGKRFLEQGSHHCGSL